MPQALRRWTSVATAGAILATALTAFGAAGVANAAAYPTINEFSNDILDSNDPEYVEIHAAPGTNVAGHTLLVVRGGTENSPRLDGSVYRSIPVTGTTDANGLLNVPLAVNTILNSAVTLMLVTGPAPAVNADLDANDDGALDAGLAFTIVDSVGTTTPNGIGRAYGDTILAPTFDGGTTSVGGASREVDGVDTNAASDWVRNAYSGRGIPGYESGAIADGDAIATPGQPNMIFDDGTPPVDPPVDPPGPVECDADGATLISAVQGTGAASPVAGTNVEVQGVVVADQPGLQGYVVQEETADQDVDPLTSEAVFVYATGSTTDVTVGDQVRVGGAVSEFFGLTEITQSGVSICEQAQPLPAATEVSLPLANAESVESMLVTFPAPLTVIETFEFARYGSIELGTERQFQPTALYAPGSPEAVQLAADNLANRIILDDNLSSQNPPALRHPNGEPFSLDNIFRGGDTVANVTGVLDWRNDAWRVQPTEGADYTAANPRPEVPQVGGSLQVASFNVLNYFTTLGSRGADTAAELELQEAKIVAAILEMDADIVGLIEIQNNGTAVQTLVAALNEAAGEELYTPVVTGVLGTDEIIQAFIYKADMVTPQGRFAALDSSIDPRFDTSLQRPALTQTFAETATGALLTVSVNHLKSKNQSDACGPIDPNGQGACNAVRAQAAAALADWLATDPTGADTDDVLIIGDLNSYDHEDPIVALETAGFVDLEEQFQGEEAYSYVFDGQLGYLDYAMASESLVDSVTGAQAWNANSDEVPILGYELDFKGPSGLGGLYAPDPYRASDHDAVLVGLDLEAPTPVEPSVTTLGGTDRFETNVATSEALFEPGTDVYLASGFGFADALAAGPAAAHDDASLLLTPTDRLLPVTLGELDRLAPATITIVGGEPSVTGGVEQELAARYPDVTITRIAGDDRFETAADLATQVFGSAERAFVTSGLSFPDALSASGAASAVGDMPVLLTAPGFLPDVTADALDSLGVSDAYVLGSRVTVSDAALRQVREYASAIRIAGADRYATNAAVVARFTEPTDPQAIVVASGVNFPDALSATAASGVSGAPLLLSTGQCVLLDTEEVIDELQPSFVLGPDVVSGSRASAVLQRRTPRCDRRASSRRPASAAGCRAPSGLPTAQRRCGTCATARQSR